MIEINLVPEHLRKKKRGSSLVAEGFILPKEMLVGIVGGFVALLVLVIVGLQLLIISRSVQYKNYTNQMKAIEQDKSGVDRVIHDLRTLQTKFKAINEITAGQNISLSQKLNDISDNLPRGVWLDRITLEDEAMRIQGSAVSKNKTEMINVHNFTAQLKNSETFSQHFEGVELELIKSRKIGLTPVADFTIIAGNKEQ